MSLKILFVGSLAIALLSSCSSAYKIGQTPDDVYYSPSRPANEAKTKRQEDDSYTRPDDNYLRMKVQNRRVWGSIDDVGYWNSYDYNCHCNNNWSVYNKWGYNSWGSWDSWNRGNNYYGYNSGWGYGYGYPIIYVQTPRSNTGAKPYMGAYTNRNYDNTNNSSSSGKNSDQKTSSGLGSLLKTIFGGSSNTNSNSSSDSYSRPVRTFDNNSSSNTNSSTNRSSGGTSTNTGRSGRRGGGNP